MDILRVLRRMHCNPILILLAISRLAKVGWDATGLEWFSLDYERPKSFFTPQVLGMMSIDAGRNEVSEGGHDEIRPAYQVEFVNRGMSPDFTERGWNLLLQRGDGDT